MRTHQELVRYESADDDTFKLVVETIKAKLSGILAMPAEHDGTWDSPDKGQKAPLLLTKGLTAGRHNDRETELNQINFGPVS